MRIDAVGGNLTNQIKTLPMNYNCLDFIDVGQRGMVLVLESANLIFFSYIDSGADGLV